MLTLTVRFYHPVKGRKENLASLSFIQGPADAAEVQVCLNPSCSMVNNEQTSTEVNGGDGWMDG